MSGDNSGTEITHTDWTKRQVLAVTGTAVTGAFAGCSGDDGGTGEEPAEGGNGITDDGDESGDADSTGDTDVADETSAGDEDGGDATTTTETQTAEVAESPDEHPADLPLENHHIGYKESMGSVGVNQAEWLEVVGFASEVGEGEAGDWSPVEDTWNVQLSVRNVGDERVSLVPLEDYEFTFETFDANGEPLVSSNSGGAITRELAPGDIGSVFKKGATGTRQEDFSTDQVESYEVNVECQRVCPGTLAQRSYDEKVDGDPVAESSIDELKIVDHTRDDLDSGMYLVDVTVENTGDQPSASLYDYDWQMQVYDEYGNPLVRESQLEPGFYGSETAVLANKTATVSLRFGEGYTRKRQDVGYGWYEVRLQCPEEESPRYCG